MFKYKILAGTDAEEIRRKVENHVNNRGWQLWGGLHVLRDRNWNTPVAFLQVVIKNPPP